MSQSAAATTVIVAARQDTPLRVAVISDIHANLHALEAVLGAIDADPPDEVWCLGDLVGYGPRPNEATELVRERQRVCLVGNHDLAVLGRLDLDDFAPDAAVAARWTQTVLLDENRAYLESLSPEAKVEGAELYHASPRDPIWEYVIDEWTARDALESTVAPVVLVGHSSSGVSNHSRSCRPAPRVTIACSDQRGSTNCKSRLPRMPMKAGRFTDMPLTDTSFRSSSWNMTTPYAAR